MKNHKIKLILQRILNHKRSTGVPYHLREQVANEAAIYYKMLHLAQEEGIEPAMRYFHGNHSYTEYKEFLK